MSLDNTKTVRVSNEAQEFLIATAEANHVSVAFLVDFMLRLSKAKLLELFAQKPKA